jgi:hypothetical protein
MLDDIQEESMGTPDELLVMPTEEFLALLTEQFKHVPFVAHNASRSFVFNTAGDVPEGTPPDMVGMVAIGFALDEYKLAGNMMTAITNHDLFVMTTDNDEINAVLNKILEAEPDARYVGNLGDPEPESSEDDQDGAVEY